MVISFSIFRIVVLNHCSTVCLVYLEMGMRAFACARVCVWFRFVKSTFSKDPHDPAHACMFTVFSKSQNIL